MTFVKTHQPCDVCGSDKGKSYNDDGSAYCFNCAKLYRDETDPVGESSTMLRVAEPVVYKRETPSEVAHKLQTGTYSALIDRRIKKETAEKYSALVDGRNVIFGYYGDGLEPIAAKIRYPDKKFKTEGRWTDGKLFGQQCFGGGGRYITITEGEIDAMSVSQMFDNKYPVVSIRNGASSAVKDCTKNYDYLNSFENVIICFDADEPGQRAAKEVAELFGTKSKIVNLTEGKDANEYLVNNKSLQFTTAWWNAAPFTPDGIVSAYELLDSVLVPMKRSNMTYPWTRLDNMLYGIRPAELITLCSGSGLGKSTILREMVVHMLRQTDMKMGLMFLEETPERTLRGLIGLEMNKPIHLPDVQYAPEEVMQIYTDGDYENRVYFWDSFGSNEIERVLGRMRYFVKGLGCKFIVLDHLSILVSDQQNGDERKAIDMIMTKLRMFAQEMRITLLLVSHLKRPEGKSLEDGAVTSLGMLRGSASIAQLSDAVIGAERNSQAEDPDERNRTRLRVLKNRFSGKTGPAGYLVYNEETGRLTEEEDAL